VISVRELGQPLKGEQKKLQQFVNIVPAP